MQRGNFGPFVQHATRNRGNSGVLARTRLGPFRTDTRENPYLSWDIKIAPGGLPKLKFLAVRRSVERDPRPFVWIDDDIDFFLDGAVTPCEWAAGLSMPHLLIAPDCDSGLLPYISMPSRSSCASTASAHALMTQAPRSLRRVPHPKPLP